MAAFAKGDFAAARAEQLRSIQLIEPLAEFGFMGAAKALMGFLGLDVGPPRLPNASLTSAEQDARRAKLEKIGYLKWIRAEKRFPKHNSSWIRKNPDGARNAGSA